MDECRWSMNAIYSFPKWRYNWRDRTQCRSLNRDRMLKKIQISVSRPIYSISDITWCAVWTLDYSQKGYLGHSKDFPQWWLVWPQFNPLILSSVAPAWFIDQLYNKSAFDMFILRKLGKLQAASDDFICTKFIRWMFFFY